MPSILVIEHEGRYIERIQDALSSEGWKPRFVAGRPEALRAAASEQPDLVLVNADLPGAAELLRTFALQRGGPGTVALLSEHQGSVAAAELGADEVLSKPFTDQQLRLVVRRGLARTHAPAPPAAVPAQPAEEEAKLSSQDIFGDLLAEVEAEAPGPAVPAVAASGAAAAERQAGGEPPAPPAPPPRPASARGGGPLDSDDPEIARRLEMTLSGVLGAPRKRRDPARSDAAAVAPRAAPTPAVRPPRRRRRRPPAPRRANGGRPPTPTSRSCSTSPCRASNPATAPRPSAGGSARPTTST